jgi:2-iminobutanoate/2-iminopropanoate deaminase
MEKQSRRGLLKNAATAVAAVAGTAVFAPEAKAQSGTEWKKKAVPPPPAPATPPTPPPAKLPPLFSGIVTFGNLVFLSGVGAHFPGTIEEHTKHVLDELERNLVAAGSSMQKVLKVNVYLTDITNFARMNSVYAGRFGEVPPARTTVAVAAVPGGDSLVEIECIASI